jgi:phosphatidylglycerol lysyltransferase
MTAPESAADAAAADAPESAAPAPGAEAGPPKRYVPEGLARRWIRAGVTLAKIVRGAPFTLVLIAALWIVALATRSLAYGPSNSLIAHIGLDTTAITSGRPWILLTYSFWCQNVWAYLADTLLILLFVVPAERRLGTWRTVGLLALCQLGGALLAIGVVELGAWAGDLWLHYGLWRGRRMAWWAALVCEAVLGAVTVRYAQMLVEATEGRPGEDGVPTAIKIYTGLIMCIPVGVVLVLLLTRRHFALRAPRWTALKLLGTLALTFLVVGALYVNTAFRVSDQWSPNATVSALLADYPKRLFSPTWLTLVNEDTAALIPEGGAAKALYIAVGPAFWLIALGGLFLTFRRTAIRADGGKDKADRLLTAYGGSALSYMTTWPGNRYWISPDGTAAVAYRVIGGVALTTGEPYGKAESRAQAVRQFAGHCDGQGWSPCFYSVTEQTKEVTDRLGWSAVQVAEDTVLDLPGLKFSGKKWQDVRTALNKAGKAGITAQWFTFPTAPLAVQQHIRELSEEWVADKGLPEMGFTLGGLGELQDPRVRCLLALDEEGRLHGVTSWLPVYEDGEPIGWTLDFMRRAGDGFRGVMEFLIASAALGFQQEGARFLSLSGAPLARVERAATDGRQPVPLQRVLDVAGKALEPVYGFRSLLAFKAKFQPQYFPLYMCYPDPAALPAIGNAIGRAYLPHTNAAQMMRLSRKLMG